MGPHVTYESPTTSFLDAYKLDPAHPTTTSEDTTDAGQIGSALLLSKKACVKKANLYAWLSLQQLPEVSAWIFVLQLDELMISRTMLLMDSVVT